LRCNGLTRTALLHFSGNPLLGDLPQNPAMCSHQPHTLFGGQSAAPPVPCVYWTMLLRIFHFVNRNFPNRNISV